MQMKVKIVKTSNHNLWYSEMTLPVEFNVIKSNNSLYMVDEPDNINYHEKYIFINDCFNNEEETKAIFLSYDGMKLAT